MEIKLPIYEGKQVAKIYTAETYDIMFGTVEDLIDAVDMEKFMSGNNNDLVEGVAKAIPKIFGMIKPLFKDIFEGLTDEEIKHTKVKDVAKVIVAIVKFSVSQVVTESNEKN